MVIDWLNSLKPWQARRVSLVYFNLICWTAAAVIVRIFW